MAGAEQLVPLNETSLSVAEICPPRGTESDVGGEATFSEATRSQKLWPTEAGVVVARGAIGAAATAVGATGALVALVGTAWAGVEVDGTVEAPTAGALFDDCTEVRTLGAGGA